MSNNIFKINIYIILFLNIEFVISYTDNKGKQKKIIKVLKSNKDFLTSAMAIEELFNSFTQKKFQF